MQDFFNNISRYPRFFITIVLGIFFALYERVKPLFKNPISAVAIVGLLLSSFTFIFFTLQAMLGLN
jgi:hypothetical protein